MKAFLPFAAALALNACATTTAAAPPVRTDGQARIGQSTRVGDMVVTPRSVVEDSRCPINARCVWAGRLVIEATIEYNGGSEEMRSRLTLGESLSLGRQRITLISGEPGKMAGQALRPRDYLFGFEAR